MDMHSGGYRKTPYDYVYIQARRKKALETFFEIFGVDPTDISCSCCGHDYAIDEYKSLKAAKEYDPEEKPKLEIKVVKNVPIRRSRLHKLV